MVAKIVFTDEELRLVEEYAELGMNECDIAEAVFAVSRTTFCERKKTHPELLAAIKRGKTKGGVFVMGALRKLISQGCVSSTIFYLKTRHKWVDESRFNIKIDVTKMSKEDKIKFLADFSAEEKMSLIEALIEPQKKKPELIEHDH